MARVKKQSPKPKYEYQILLNRKVVWHGTNVKKKLADLSKKHPKIEMGIKWVPKEGVLIAKSNLSL